MKIMATLLLAGVLLSPAFPQAFGQPKAKSQGIHSSPGPSLPPAKGLDPLMTRAFFQPRLRNGASAVVIVEDFAPAPMPSKVLKRRVFRLLVPPADPALALPDSAWMTGSRVVSGGNTVSEIYPLGWGY